MNAITNDKIKSDIFKIIEFFKKSEVTDEFILNKKGLGLFSFLKKDKEKGRNLFFDNVKILDIQKKDRKSIFAKLFNLSGKFNGYEVEVKAKLKLYFLLNNEFDKTWGSDSQGVADTYIGHENQIEIEKKQDIDVVFKIVYDKDLKIDHVDFIDRTRFNIIFP